MTGNFTSLLTQIDNLVNHQVASLSARVQTSSKPYMALS